MRCEGAQDGERSIRVKHGESFEKVNGGGGGALLSDVTSLSLFVFFFFFFFAAGFADQYNSITWRERENKFPHIFFLFFNPPQRNAQLLMILLAIANILVGLTYTRKTNKKKKQSIIQIKDCWTTSQGGLVLLEHNVALIQMI